MSVKRWVSVMVLVGLLSGGGSALAQGGGPVTGAAALALPTSVGVRVFPAPDGHQVAFESNVRVNSHIDRFVCVLDALAGTEPVCVAPPEPQPRDFDPDPRSTAWPVGWAADGTRLAFVGLPLLNGQDGDLWILDVAAGTWANLTDDGYAGSLRPAEGEAGAPAGATIETQPVWSPDGAWIAVEQTTVGEEHALGSTTLSLIEVATGAARALAPLPGSDTPAPEAGTITGLAWSPDGTQIAFTQRHAEPDPAVDGLWLAAVDSGELTRLLDWPALDALFRGAYPDVALDRIGPLAWSPDGARLMVWGGNLNSTPVAIWPLLIDAASGEGQALPLPAHERDSGARRAVWPLQAAWSPDGSAILTATNGFYTGEAMDSLDAASPRARIAVRRVDVASGEMTLLGGLPTGIAVPFFLASWGAGGDAILDGYHLTLAAE